MTKEPVKPQIDKFKETAKEVGSDDSQDAFDAVLKRVAKPVKVSVPKTPPKSAKAYS